MKCTFCFQIDIIVKLGGSAITNKSVIETVKMPELYKASQLIKSCIGKGLKCIVVHGAGSFGHHQAKEYEVNKGWFHGENSEIRKVKEGFSKTRLSVLKLNQIVTQSFIECDIPAIGVPACGTWFDELDDFDASNMAAHVVSCIDNGFVPICHGDAIFDTRQGCRILSGDVIIRRLCNEFSVNRVVFLSDVQGVYTKPPDEDDTTLISEICVRQDGNVDMPVHTDVSGKDVTGGIKLKIDCACEIVRESKGKTSVFVAFPPKEPLTLPQQAVSKGNLAPKLCTKNIEYKAE